MNRQNSGSEPSNECEIRNTTAENLWCDLFGWVAWDFLNFYYFIVHKHDDWKERFTERQHTYLQFICRSHPSCFEYTNCVYSVYIEVRLHWALGIHAMEKEKQIPWLNATAVPNIEHFFFSAAFLLAIVWWTATLYISPSASRIQHSVVFFLLPLSTRKHINIWLQVGWCRVNGFFLSILCFHEAAYTVKLLTSISVPRR